MTDTINYYLSNEALDLLGMSSGLSQATTEDAMNKGQRVRDKWLSTMQKKCPSLFANNMQVGEELAELGEDNIGRGINDQILGLRKSNPGLINHYNTLYGTHEERSGENVNPTLGGDLLLMNVCKQLPTNDDVSGRMLICADPKLRELAEQNGVQTIGLMDFAKQNGVGWWQRRKIQKGLDQRFPPPPKPSRWQRFKNWFKRDKTPDPQIVRERGQQLDEQRIIMQREIDQKSRGVKVKPEVSKKDKQLHEQILEEIPKKSREMDL